MMFIPHLLAIGLILSGTTGTDQKMEFARDVRPLLSNACFKCHGPAVQKGKLRLDLRDSAIASGAIVPGKPATSTLITRICEPNDDDGRMPPPEAGGRLDPEQVKVLKRWIAAGAEYTPHWAFTPVQRPVPPAVPGLAIDHPIDLFIRARLIESGLTPSPEADRSTLIRRVTLDLTGLLPTLQEIDEFERDEAPNAYEKVVDRLLASPHYGERQARHWLDLARYADSNGYTIDSARSIWPYRDWVIQALNADMPFDQFTREQLAGDLLPNPTVQQKIATGFHRNTPFNEEGGTDPEQFRVERTIDRTNTTGIGWLGLSVGCAQCHDHKYDPISQKEYYQLYAFFDSCDEPTLPVGGKPSLELMISKLNAMAADLQKVGDAEGVKQVYAEIKKIQGGIPTTLVMRERPVPRGTHVHIRGDFLRPGEHVTPGLPNVLVQPSSLNPGRRLGRLDLARWLTSTENPLTSRVVVNREWQKFFGRGLVETENDFGFQGSYPTHKELLEWLAAEFMQPTESPRQAWSMKSLHKLIVMSATYRQSSVHRAELTTKDPRNLLLGRQSRLRLEAESIRDVALGASGLLNPKVGGPGVFPPQAREAFALTQSQRKWTVSPGADRFRRGMYTFIWRQSQHPLMTTFDAADAQTACTRRNRSNTPLQALHLANDPVFVELAEGFGKRIQRDGPSDDSAKIAFAFRIAFAREPSTGESEKLMRYLELQKKFDPQRAWIAIARVLMNLDEFITRE